MMQKSVANTRLVYIAWFGIVNLKRKIPAVPVASICQFCVERQNIVHQIDRKLFYIFPPSFAPYEFPPSGKQIFNRGDTMIDMPRNNLYSLSLSLENASILNRVKEGYLLWMNIVPHMSKGARYTIGERVENKLLDLLEISYRAYFAKKDDKLEKVAGCILINDTIKFLVTTAWEGKLISDKHCELMAQKLIEIGKMLGGWKNSLTDLLKKNRTL